MKKALHSVFVIMLTVLVAVGGFVLPVSAEDNKNDIPYSTYTFWEFDEKNIIAGTRAIYSVEKTFTARDIGVSLLEELNDMCTDKNGNIYLLDGKASRIVVVNKDYSLLAEISALNFNGNELKFNGAKGIFVSSDGLIYIADTENARVLVCSTNGICTKVIELPDSKLIPDDLNYRPVKLTVDSSGYLYVLSDGSYYGAIMYSPDGSFLGFYGANAVSSTVTQIIVNIWKKLTTNNAKRAASTSKLPFTMTDLIVDKNDFVYTATGKGGSDTETAQIKQLSPGGINILNSNEVIFGNQTNEFVNKKQMVRNISGLTVDDNGFIYCFDVSYGKIYIYDKECNLVGAFGGGSGSGNQKGTFLRIAGIDIIDNGEKIVAIDSQKLSVTVFKETEYGKNLKQAQNLLLGGKYDESEELWNELLKQDANCQLAYIGLATVAMSHDDYHNALKYSKLGADKEIYSKAFEQTRNSWIEEHFTVLMFILLVLVGIIVAFAVVKRKKQVVIINNKNIKLLMSAQFHPTDIFGEIKYRKSGSIILGGVIVLLYYISAILKSTASGFLFKESVATSFNSILVLLQTVGFIVLWTVVNWAVAVLLGGIGKLREIFIIVTYSIVPMLFGNIVYTVLSHCLNASEGEFLSVFVVVMTLYSVFMVIVGSMIVHDISFGKFAVIALLTVLGLAIVIFLIVLIIILSQHLVGFIGTIIQEIFLRK